MPVIIATVEKELPVFRPGINGQPEPTGRMVKPKFNNPFEVAEKSIRNFAKAEGRTAELGGFKRLEGTGVLFVDCDDALGLALVKNVDKLNGVASVEANEKRVRALQNTSKPTLNGGW